MRSDASVRGYSISARGCLIRCARRRLATGASVNDSLRDRLRNFEDQFTERKTEGAANKAELRKTLVGLANTVPEDRTAVLFIGVTDGGEIAGVSSPDALQKTVTEVCQHNCYPALRSVAQEVLDAEGKAVLAVVSCSRDRPHFAGLAYVRRGSQTVVASEGGARNAGGQETQGSRVRASAARLLTPFAETPRDRTLACRGPAGRPPHLPRREPRLGARE